MKITVSKVSIEAGLAPILKMVANALQGWDFNFVFG